MRKQLTEKTPSKKELRKKRLEAKRDDKPTEGGGEFPAPEKPKSFKHAVKSLVGYMGKNSWYVLFSFILAIITAAAVITGPKFMEKMFALITEGVLPVGGAPPPGIDLSLITTLGIILACIYIVSNTANYFSNFIMAFVTTKLSKRMAYEVFTKANRLPLSYYDKNSFGDVLSRITNDNDTITETLNQIVAPMVRSAVQIVGVLIMMFTVSWELTLVNLGMIPISFIVVAIVAKSSQKYFKAQQGAMGKLNGHIEEIYSQQNIVKVYNGENDALQKFNEINADLYKSSYKSQFVSGLMFPIMNIMGNITYVIVCIVGGIIAINRQDPKFLASIVAFIIYVRQFNQPVAQIAQNMASLQSTAAASERVFGFLAEEEQPPENDDLVKLPSVQGKVEFKNVSFGYVPDKEIIHGFSAVANPGQKVAIVGHTGAGKTTIVQLLMRFYEINGGEILIDGVPISNMSREDVRAKFGMVLQDTWLFEGTVRENLCFNTEGVSDERMEEASKAAGIHHYVKSLPGGYDHVLNEDTAMSEGQKQLITIGRAMLENAPMLILDEATSNVDTRTEEVIQVAMDKLMQGRTSFVIAHRLSTIKNADLILVMDGGDVVESGNHEELLVKNGHYAGLYNSQFAE